MIFGDFPQGEKAEQSGNREGRTLGHSTIQEVNKRTRPKETLEEMFRKAGREARRAAGYGGKRASGSAQGCGAVRS